MGRPLQISEISKSRKRYHYLQHWCPWPYTTYAHVHVLCWLYTHVLMQDHVFMDVKWSSTYSTFWKSLNNQDASYASRVYGIVINNCIDVRTSHMTFLMTTLLHLDVASTFFLRSLQVLQLTKSPSERPQPQHWPQNTANSSQQGWSLSVTSRPLPLLPGDQALTNQAPNLH